jgi:malonyl-CoA O-methyltransferase
MSKIKKIRDFDRAAKDYKKNAVMQLNIADELIDQLSVIKIKPNKILDIGSANGILNNKLTKLFPAAKIVNLDISIEMLKESKKEDSFIKSLFGKKNILRINGDMDQMPFADESFDLIITSSSIQWSDDVKKLFNAISNILNTGGLFIFSTFMDGTLNELDGLSDELLINKFLNIHDYAFCLSSNSLMDPVLTTDTYQLKYKNPKEALLDLKKLGVTKSNSLKKGLRGKGFYEKLINHLKLSLKEDFYFLTYEVCFGHAWKKDDQLSKPINFI